MKIVLAPDSFKGTLSASSVCQIEARAIREVLPEAQIVTLPLADGGEGTLEAVANAHPRTRRIAIKCHDPLGGPITAEYLALPDGATAVVELAQASGLHRLSQSERNPLLASTFGTGEILRGALEQGFRKIVVGLGGSATVDGGLGIAQALGVEIFDLSGKPLAPRDYSVAEILARAHHRTISAEAQRQLRFDSTQLVIATDVTNPLLGSQGAAAVFGPQKGATPPMVAQLESALANWARLWNDDGSHPGDGAAGGVAFLLRMLFPRQTVLSGGELLCEMAELDAHLADADLAITGEGASDAQTLNGKLPLIVSRHARRANVPCALLSGFLPPEAACALEPHFHQLAGTCSKPLPPEELTHEACEQRLSQATKRLIKTILGKN